MFGKSVLDALAKSFCDSVDCNRGNQTVIRSARTSEIDDNVVKTWTASTPERHWHTEHQFPGCGSSGEQQRPLLLDPPVQLGWSGTSPLEQAATAHWLHCITARTHIAHVHGHSRLLKRTLCRPQGFSRLALQDQHSGSARLHRVDEEHQCCLTGKS